jgi:hypothetical protein
MGHVVHTPIWLLPGKDRGAVDGVMARTAALQRWGSVEGWAWPACRTRWNTETTEINNGFHRRKRCLGSCFGPLHGGYISHATSRYSASSAVRHRRAHSHVPGRRQLGVPRSVIGCSAPGGSSRGWPAARQQLLRVAAIHLNCRPSVADESPWPTRTCH